LADPSERCKEAGYRHRCSRRVAIMLSYLPIEISNIGARFWVDRSIVCQRLLDLAIGRKFSSGPDGN
jgi:hypothetical protein